MEASCVRAARRGEADPIIYGTGEGGERELSVGVSHCEGAPTPFSKCVL